MGKTYQKYDGGAEGSKRYPSLKDKKKKVSMHGHHCNKKTCRACNPSLPSRRRIKKGAAPHGTSTIGEKKYYTSQKHLDQHEEYTPSTLAYKKKYTLYPGGTNRMKWGECSICYENVWLYGYNQVQCGPRKVVHTVCHGCKIDYWNAGNDTCPMCRSHPLEIDLWAENGCKKR